MARQGGERGPGPDGAEPRRGGAASGPGGAARGPGLEGRRDAAGFTAAERLSLLRAFDASGEGMRGFCAAHGISTATLCAWRRRLAASGEAGLEPRPNPRHAGKPGRKPYPPEERRRAVEAFAKSGMTAVDFARVFGISTKSLGKWRRRYEEGGPKALESRPGKRRGRGGGAAKAMPASLKGEITRVLRRFPSFGLRRVRDWMLRFGGVKVSAGTVRRVRNAEGIAPPEPPRLRRRKAPAVRRFERSRPRELWQSDITSVFLPRHGQRCYLVVFLDDFSRYVVGWRLATHQRGEMVIEALLDATARFGKPKEVLTDQGRQYYSWRGKSEFEKVLEREGIEHVVSRAHHPETLGKCERLWETLNAELWGRARPEDLEEGRERLAHYFAHYNHFRPHQGIEGLVPADRFFGAEDLVRKEIERRLQENELRLAVGERPRQGVYLVGQVGERQVSVHGEKGKVVIRTEEGVEEIEADSLGAPGAREEEDDGDERDGGDEGAALPEAAIQEGAEDAGAGEGALGAGDGGGAEEGARDVRAAPGALAREGDEGGGGGAAEGAAAAGVADLAAGAGGDGGGVPAAAEGAEGCGKRAGRADGYEEEAPGARAGGAGEGCADRAAEGDAGAPREAAGGGGEGDAAWVTRSEEEGSERGSGDEHGSASGDSSGRGE